VTLDPGGPAERHLEGLVDDEPIAAGTLVRIDTTGGGGWGDPLEREVERVALDVRQGKVSLSAARNDYGVAFSDDAGLEVDLAATDALRQQLRVSRGVVPFFDRGPGYRLLSGRDSAEVDLI
jgi:N-methylhydantoinase B